MNGPAHTVATTPSGDGVLRWDAGDLTCGGPLPRELRSRLSAMTPGDVLEVTAGDPAARHDLPALARLMGHHVLHTTTAPDGRFVITIRRG